MERIPICNWCEARMQYALTRRNNLFDFSRYAVVPNVSWGLGLNHEADLLCLSKSSVFHEIEIKVSLSDLKNDRDKRHTHYSKFIKYLWFAIPDVLPIDKSLELIPYYAGLVQIRPYYNTNHFIHRYSTKIIKKPKLRNKLFEKPKQETIIKFLRLGVLRMWTDTQRFKDFDNKAILR